MLKAGTTILLIWCGINFFLAAMILITLVVFGTNSPLLVMVFEKPEIAEFDPRVIASLNTLTILYNSCSVVVSVFVWNLLKRGFLQNQPWVFWVLLITIGFIEIMAFIASAQVSHARWQVNVLQTLLYLVGIILSGVGLFK